MFSFLLDKTTPELEVTIGDNIQNIFEEYGTELWFMFILGIITGIIISIAYSAIKKMITFNDNNTSTTNQESEK